MEHVVTTDVAIPNEFGSITAGSCTSLAPPSSTGGCTSATLHCIPEPAVAEHWANDDVVVGAAADKDTWLGLHSRTEDCCKYSMYRASSPAVVLVGAAMVVVGANVFVRGAAARCGRWAAIW